MALALAGALRLAGDWFAMGMLLRAVNLAVLVGGGAAVYFLACRVVGLRVSDFRIKTVA
jgi:hypothetical protein